MERGSSVVERRTRNQVSPGSNPSLVGPTVSKIGHFRSLHRRPVGGNVSDFVFARNCSVARLLPEEAENGVGMNRSATGG